MRRRLAWLVGCIIVLTATIAVLLILPNTPGSPPPPGAEAVGEDSGGTTPFFIGLTVVFFLMVLTVVYGVIRFLWRLHTGDIESAGSDGDTWRRKQRRDLEQAMRSGSE